MISQGAGCYLAERCGGTWVETSACTGENVSWVFRNLWWRVVRFQLYRYPSRSTKRSKSVLAVRRGDIVAEATPHLVDVQDVD